MMSLTRNNYVTGIIIKKIKYRDYHEILHVLTEHGCIESFFYENVYKNKKKLKVNIPYKVLINYFPTGGMNKIIALEIENMYNTIIYDVMKNAYATNIIEYIAYSNDTYLNIYKLLGKCLDYMNRNISERLVTIYCLINLLKVHGFNFKYQKTDLEYVAYSFRYSIFVDKNHLDQGCYTINNSLVKLVYYFSIKPINFLETLDISDRELVSLFEFCNLLFKEYVGIETKSYPKIIELEKLLNSI
ncbi:DNA repair protein RecO [Gemella sp. oral taxon 928]|nr:DNA repair protein RecO [Gemella sp. oral taxon 928]AXI27119.1 DNA repair protein RecO [Gemella sp. ND 6198]